MSNIRCFYPVGVITILGAEIIGGMIWITRSNVKFSIRVNSEGQFIENETNILSDKHYKKDSSSNDLSPSSSKFSPSIPVSNVVTPS